MIKKKESAAIEFANLLADFEQRDSFHIDAAKVEISEQIYQAMRNKGVTEAELSRRLGVSRAYVNKILQGNVNFTIETLVKISRALDCKFEFQFASNKAKADILDAEIIYERIAKTVSTPSPRHGYSSGMNVLAFEKYKLNKTRDFLITDTEVILNQKSEGNYASGKNAA